MYLVVIIAALAMYWAGYCVVWSARDNADLHKD